MPNVLRTSSEPGATQFCPQGMSLQYRTRRMSDDRDWLQRCTLCTKLLVEVLDWWCRNDESDFPVAPMVISILYLFSPKCNPFQESARDLRERLFQSQVVAIQAFQTASPNPVISAGNALLLDLTSVLGEAVKVWSNNSITQLPPESVSGQIARCIVSHKFVLFHHRESTRRDGGFYGYG